MLTVKQISKSFGTRVVLADASFALGKGEKAALVGPNGVGKTTLLRILAGIDEMDSGSIEIQKNSRIGYLEQDTSLMGDDTVFEYLKKTIGTSDENEKIDEYDEKTIIYRAQAILAGFGFEEDDLHSSISNLSSGQKVKVSLAGILLKGVELLLLDEPTNNLDLPSLIWLESYLKNSDAVAIIISHDRRFLDKVADKIIEIDPIEKKVKVTGGKYSDYLEHKLKQFENLKVVYRIQQEKIEQLTEEIRNKKIESEQGSKWVSDDNDKALHGFKREKAGKSGRRAKAIEKRLNKIEKIERPKDKEPLEIPLEAPSNPGVLHITLDDVIAGYKDGFSIGPVSIDITYGNRIGIMGLNGSGKSTILKTLTGEIAPIKGTIKIGSGLRMGNMMQEHQSLPKNISPINFLEKEAKLSVEESYSLLSKFNIDDQQARRLIKDLSPGSRARLILSLFSAQSVNLLILDEPTNHLDMEAFQALEETIENYLGTIILVSHDRYFLEKAKLTSVYQISDGKFSRIGEFNEYIKAVEKRADKLIKML